MIRPRKRSIYIISLLAALSFIPCGATATGVQKSRSEKGRAQKAAASKASEAWRRRAPRPAPARPFKLPAAREVKLENGLTLVMIEDRRTPMVTINIGIRLSLMPYVSFAELTNQLTLAEATAELLTEGAGGRTSEELSRTVETLGGQLSSSAGSDYTQIDATVVAENVEQMIEIIGDVLMRPTFPENEVALYKNNRAQNLVVQRQEPSFLVSEHFDRIIYGAHPYAISAPTPEAIAQTDRKKIESFYKSTYSPAATVAVIVGDFDAARLEDRAGSVFSRWNTREKKTASGKAHVLPERAARRVYLIDRPGSEQADFRVGNLAIAQADPDYFPLLVANTILGGGTSSRLFLNLREQKGYTYDVYSSIEAPRERGSFYGASQTRTEVTLAALKDMLAEFDRLSRVKVTASDLQNAKNYLTGVFSLALSTQGGMADQVLKTYMLGLGPSYLESYRAKVEQVSAEAVQQAARKYILTDRAAIVVVGDAAKLKKQLSALGPLEVFDNEGKPLK